MKSKTCLGIGSIILLAMLSLLGYSDVKLKGGIVGVVVDENNEALPGVNVTLTGEKAFAKSQSKVTNEKGVFRFLDLNPGAYELELKLPQFNILKIENIRVKIGEETPIRARLSLTKLNEEVVVTAQAPLIDTQTAHVSTTISADQMDKLPQTRYFLDFTEAVAGVNDRGAYGSAGTRTQYGDYYTGSITNSVTLNGVDVGTLSNGQTWVNPALDTIEEVEVLAVGASAAYGNFTGANINVVTKSGTNKFHGGLSSYYTDSSLYGDNSGGEPELKIGDLKYRTETVATLGGPIIKEKLFFFLAGGYTGEKHRLYEAPNYATKKQPHYQARLDWRVSKNNSLTLMFNSDPLDHDNLGLMTGSGPEIASSRIFRSQSVYGSWTSVIKSDTLFTVKYAGFRGKDKEQPAVLDKPTIWDGVYNRKLQSAGWAMFGDRNRDQFNASLTHYADSLLGASHEIEMGFEYENSSAKQHDFAAGNAAVSIYPGYGGLVDAYATTNYDYNGTAKLRAVNGFIQDNVKIGNKLTLNLGARYESSELKAISGNDGTSNNLVKMSHVDPRLGLSYDFGGDAKNVAHLSYGRYHQKLASGAFIEAMPGFATITYYGWFDMAYPDLSTPGAIDNFLAELFSPEHYWFSRGGPNLTAVAEDLSAPYTDVFNVGFERQLSRDIVLSVEFVHKRDRNFVIEDTLTPHTYEEIQWTDPYLGKTIPLWIQTDDNYYDEAILRNSTYAKRNHNFLTVTLRKRNTGKWTMMTSYTYQRSTGNMNNWDDDAFGGYYNLNADSDPNFLQNPMRWGLLDFNRTHQFKLTGSYLLPWGLVVSGDLHLMSGRRWTPELSYGDTPAGSKWTGMQAFLENRGSRQMPMKKMLNLRVAKQFGLGGSSTIELSLDAMNVFNDPDATHYYTAPNDVYAVTYNSAFGKPRWIGSPRSLQAGIRWKF